MRPVGEFTDFTDFTDPTDSMPCSIISILRKNSLSSCAGKSRHPDRVRRLPTFPEKNNGIQNVVREA